MILGVEERMQTHDSISCVWKTTRQSQYAYQLLKTVSVFSSSSVEVLVIFFTDRPLSC